MVSIAVYLKLIAAGIVLQLVQVNKQKEKRYQHIHLKNKNTMPFKNLPAKKNTGYVYTEADLGEGLLHAGVSHLYWIGQEVNKK